jgi:hypothetical protein
MPQAHKISRIDLPQNVFGSPEVSGSNVALVNDTIITIVSIQQFPNGFVTHRMKNKKSSTSQPAIYVG